MAERLPLIEQDTASDDNILGDTSTSIRSRRSGNHLPAYYDNSHYSYASNGIPLTVRERSSSGTPPSVRAGVPSGGTLTDDDDAVDVEIDPAKDTLQGIAVRYYTSVAKLKRLNQLSTEQELYGRRSLKVPHTNFGVFIGKLVDVEASLDANTAVPASSSINKTVEVDDEDESYSHRGEGDMIDGRDTSRETRRFLQSKDKQLEVLRQNVTNSITKQKRQAVASGPTSPRNAGPDLSPFAASSSHNVVLMDNHEQPGSDAVDSSQQPKVVSGEAVPTDSAVDLTAGYRVHATLPHSQRPYDKMMSWRAIFCALLAIISIPVVIVVFILIDNEKPPSR